MDVRGKRVVVFGLAGSGRAAANLALERGATVVGVDGKLDVPVIPGVRMELGPHRIETFTDADLVVVSPGVPGTVPPIGAAIAAGVPVLGELAFAASFLPRMPMVAITGTNGKSTVTYFTGQLLEAAGMRPFVGGNLGRPYSEAALVENLGEYDVAVIEVSSYQMEFPGDVHPRAAVVINLTPDHLARHKTMESYGAHKCRLFQRMTDDDLAIVPADDALLNRLADDVGQGTRAWLGKHPGVVRDGNAVDVRIPRGDVRFRLDGFSIPGEHNKDNAALAAMLAYAMGATLLSGRPLDALADAVQAALPKLLPLAHRMQVVAERDGVTWIDDSKATNVAAAIVGVKGLDRKGVLLLGGQAKGDPFAELAPYLGGWTVLTFGGSGDAIADEFAGLGVPVTRCGPMADAVARARALARPGDVVLLSPGCASFDEFKNFEHRGDVFRELAQETK